MVPRYFIGILAPIILILSFYLSRIKSVGLRNGILAGVMGYSLLILFLKESPYFTQTTSFREIAIEAKAINNDAPVVFLTNKEHFILHYLWKNNFKNATIDFKTFSELMNRETHHEYFVFLDLRPTPKTYTDSIPVMKGYEEIYTKTFANKYNIKTVKLIQYRKLKDPL
jgi:hypothetical protein